MRSGWKTVVGAMAAAPLLLVVAVGTSSIRGDEPGRLARLFRLGGNSISSPPAPAETPGFQPPTAATVLDAPPGTPIGPSAVPTPPGAPPLATGGPAPRLVPHARVSRAATEADPLVTRITLGRSDDGNQFGMFLQVFADGTVIDSEGVHAPGREAIRGVIDAVQSGDLLRLRGHCGGPPTDFVEQVQMIVYERSFGRLRASSFSFSGNTQGCDQAVRRLQTVLDALQTTRLGRPAGPDAPASGPVTGGLAPILTPAATPTSGVPLVTPVTPSAPPIRLNEAPAGR
jgi:hypothetical protein